MHLSIKNFDKSQELDKLCLQFKLRRAEQAIINRTTNQQQAINRINYENEMDMFKPNFTVTMTDKQQKYQIATNNTTTTIEPRAVSINATKPVGNRTTKSQTKRNIAPIPRLLQPIRQR